MILLMDHLIAPHVNAAKFVRSSLKQMINQLAPDLVVAGGN